MVVGDDAMHNRESQPRPLFFGGIVWIENIWHMFLGDTLACIFDDDFDCLVSRVILCDNGDHPPLDIASFEFMKRLKKTCFKDSLSQRTLGRYRSKRLKILILFFKKSTFINRYNSIKI